ncbi:MAG TPA: threonine synthase [Candidatus Faecivivens stercorigallinarum]|nr:threonine synthase [Candidatus Faecivivens stercorigallinarum]
MNYNSTRDSGCIVTAAQAIAQGISQEGGLFVPETLPVLSREDLEKMVGMSYNEKAKMVLSRFLTDFTSEELDYCVDNAYNDRKFDSANVSEISRVGESAYLLELWHGPTCAFKDMALQLLPYLMTTSSRKTAPDKEIVVLVATSGDTGKAALEGFADVPHTRMLVFYPENGVSEMQKLQMTTQSGENVSVCAIKGNFDDAQSGVKKIFTDPVIEAELAKNGQMFSSANSINWGRLVPQIVYYIAAYTTLVEQGEIAMGETVNVTVPTGNFGNILAAYYAKLMGLPVGKLICASNRNRVLTDFIRTGVYDRNRDFYTTTSPSMDILISSNLERLLYQLCGRDDAVIRDWFGKLASEGKYTVSDSVKEKLQADFWGGFCDDEQTAATIRKTFEDYGYLCDTHTAVAVKVYQDYTAETGDKSKCIIASTASPYKFNDAVLTAISDEEIPADPFEQAEMLSRISGTTPPASLMELKTKKVRFTDSVEKEQMVEKVKEMLK